MTEDKVEVWHRVYRIAPKYKEVGYMNTRELAVKILEIIIPNNFFMKEDVDKLEALLNKERPEKQDFFSRLTVVEEENAKLKAELKTADKKADFFIEENIKLRKEYAKQIEAGEKRLFGKKKEGLK